MGSILDMIDKIRERPGILLGSPSASTLYNFLSGFAYARKENCPGDYEFLNDLNRWIRERYQVTSSQGWPKIIEFYSFSEADQMNLFWKLFDEFLAQRAPGKKKASRSSA
jgi:hypothetical protein